MRTPQGSWLAGSVTAIVLALFLAGPSWADEKDKKSKGKDEGKGQTIQIDLSKLPPDLAKQLLKYAKGGDKKEASKEKAAPPKKEEKGKDKKKEEAKKGPALPPGLAKKPKDHPGRIAFLKKAGKTEEPEKKPAKKPGKKKDDDD